MTLSLSAIQENFSMAMYSAVASICGWDTYKGQQDEWGIDITFKKKCKYMGPSNKERSTPKEINLQLKCTFSPTTDNPDYISHTLKAHQKSIYEENTNCYFALGLLYVEGSDPTQWLNSNEDSKVGHHVSSICYTGYIRTFCREGESKNELENENLTIRFNKFEHLLSADFFKSIEKHIYDNFNESQYIGSL